MRHKVISLAPFGEPTIYPMADLTSPSGDHVEIDVFLPEYQLGIECKAFEDCFAPLTENRVNSIIGRLVPQIKRYESVGVTTLGVVTNLPADAASRLASVLQSELLRQQIRAKVVFIEGTPEKLLAWLDELAGAIGNNILKGLEQRLSEHPTLPKPEVQEPEPQIKEPPISGAGPQASGTPEG